jgi:hypothetical protein
VRHKEQLLVPPWPPSLHFIVVMEREHSEPWP